MTEISGAVAGLHQLNPNSRTLDLLGDFSADVFAKLVSVFNGGTETFPDSEYTSITAILTSLKVGILSFPYWLFDHGSVFGRWNQVSQPQPKIAQLQIDPSSLAEVISRIPRFFRLRTESRQYSCPVLALGLSPLLALFRDNGGISVLLR
jgi:hypothetical protein